MNVSPEAFLSWRSGLDAYSREVVGESTSPVHALCRLNFERGISYVRRKPRFEDLTVAVTSLIGLIEPGENMSGRKSTGKKTRFEVFKRMDEMIVLAEDLGVTW